MTPNFGGTMRLELQKSDALALRRLLTTVLSDPDTLRHDDWTYGALLFDYLKDADMMADNLMGPATDNPER